MMLNPSPSVLRCNCMIDSIKLCCLFVVIGVCHGIQRHVLPRRYDMGKGVFSNPDGCGRGEGIVHLRITYTPFNMFLRHPADSVTVRLTSAP